MTTLRALAIVGLCVVALLACHIRMERYIKSTLQILREGFVTERVKLADEAYFTHGGAIAGWELENLSEVLQKELSLGLIDKKRIAYLIAKTHVRLADLYRDQNNHERAAFHSNAVTAAGIHVFGASETNWPSIFAAMRKADEMERNRRDPEGEDQAEGTR
jgi:hypothetical protein